MPRTTPALFSAEAVRCALPDGRPLFEIPSLGIGAERVGLVGANGAGKSTLLRVMAGVLEPETGRVQRPAGTAYVPQQRRSPAGGDTVADALGIGPEAAALARIDRGAGTPDDVALLADRWDLPQRVREALAAVGLAHLPLDRALTSVSGGEATRLALASPLLRAPELLLLDEPTNDLDADGRDAVRDFVRRWSRGLVVATHDRALLGEVDRILLLEHRTLRAYGGGWEAFAAQRTLERAALDREATSARAEVERTRRHVQEVRERQARRDAAGRRGRATGSQPSLVLNARRERSEGTGARLADAAARLVQDAEARLEAARATLAERDALRMALPGCDLPAGTVVVALERVAVGPDGAPLLLRDVDLHVVGPERVAIVGPNGAGKSTLLRLVAGLTSPTSGSVHRGVPVTQVAYLDQRAALLDVGVTVREAFEARHPRAERNAVHAALARFRFRAEAADQPVGTLSGGERMRAALACVLGGPVVPQCLVLDEPTNHLDLEHLEAIEAALRDYDGALVIASHDEAFLEAVGVTRRERVARWRYRTTA